jgi:SAM-dependent methyltransferase
MIDTRSVHPSAKQGYGCGAETYVRGRPDYPPQASEWLRDDLELRDGKSVLELGAGTGKFTRMIAATGARVIALDPVAEMLDRLAAQWPSMSALRGQAENIPLASATCDAVICAQSFHWFASPASLAEIRRVLRPGGVLGLVWNVRDQAVDWMAALTEIMAPFEGDAPRYDHGEWRSVFPARGFGTMHEQSFAHSHFGPPEQVIVDRIASVSFIAALEAPAREGVLDRVRTLIAATPALAGREIVEVPYVTRAYWCRAN